MNSLLIILLCVVCFVVGIIIGYVLFHKKDIYDGVLYCGINKGGDTWMGLKAADPKKIFLQDSALFKVELRDEYNSYSDKEEKSHE